MREFRILIIPVLLIIQSSNIIAQDLRFKYEDLSYGLYRSKVISTEKMSQSPTGNHSVMEKVVLESMTNKVPGQLGSEFGIEYILKSKENLLVYLDVEWIFPAIMIDNNGKQMKSFKYTIELPTNYENNSLYKLENEYEIIRGRWKVNIYFKDELLKQMEFIVE